MAETAPLIMISGKNRLADVADPPWIADATWLEIQHDKNREKRVAHSNLPLVRIDFVCQFSEVYTKMLIALRAIHPPQPDLVTENISSVETNTYSSGRANLSLRLDTTSPNLTERALIPVAIFTS
ncbi:hypothetical protein RRG08_016189 [Elysia crispata]|uniref:Uncharacterized protein n=1 Tax=Elysia crispata TaxID=231223 RepID=A0AAE1DKF5_9GAST|nr:hypothetical protein RRG08_016189 [Elysia crispata]